MNNHTPTFVSIESISFHKMEQLKKCTNIPSFYVSIDGWRYDEKIGTVLYIVEIGLELEDKILVLQNERRYSELRKLHLSLFSHFCSKFSFVPFPPKNFFHNSDVNFIRNRQKSLQEYFLNISTIEGIHRFNPFIDFFNFKKMKDIWNKECSSYETLLTPCY